MLKKQKRKKPELKMFNKKKVASSLTNPKRIKSKLTPSLVKTVVMLVLQLMVISAKEFDSQYV